MKNTRHQSKLSLPQRFAVVGSIVTVLCFVLFQSGVLGDATINFSLRGFLNGENSGLVAYYTFDGENMQLSSSTQEVLDASGNANHGNIINNASTTDAIIDSTNALATSTQFNNTSPAVVFTSKNDGYVFYVDTAPTTRKGDCVMASTTDGGLTWSAPMVVDSVNTAQSDCYRINVWYDGWTQTPSVAGTTSTSSKIHILTSDLSVDDLYYTAFDVTTKTISSRTNLTSTQGSSNSPTSNLMSITRTATGTVFVTFDDASDRFFLACAINCGTTASWQETTTNIASHPLADDWPLLLPDPSNNNLIRVVFDDSADDYYAFVYSATSSAWGATTTIDAAAVNNATYDGHFGGTVDWTHDKIYVAYAADNNDFSTQDHDLRFASYDATTWTWSTSNIATNIASRFITDVKVAYDHNNDLIYVVYSAGTSATTNQRLYYRTSSDQGTTWSAEQGPMDDNAYDRYGGANIPIMGENIYNFSLGSSTPASSTVQGRSVSAPFGNYEVMEGRVGQGYEFDGTDDYVNIGSPASLDNLGQGTPMTFAAWIKPYSGGESDGTYSGAIATKGGGDGWWISLSEDPTNAVRWTYGCGGTSLFKTSATSTITYGDWQHVVVTSDGSVTAANTKIYINGAETGYHESISCGTSLDDDSSANLTIGGFAEAGNFDGIIDDVRIFNRELSADDVSRIYKLGATTKLNQTLDAPNATKSDLVAHWTMDGEDINLAQNTGEVRDRTGNANHGDWRNHASTTKPGRIGGAIEFDAVNDDVDVGSGSTIDGLARTSPMTFAAWIYPYTDGEGDGTFGGVIATKGTGDGWWVSLSENPANAVRWTQGCSASTLFKTTSAGTIANNKWQHVVITTDATTEADNVHIYIDGVEQGYFEAIDCASAFDDDSPWVMTIGGNFGANTFDGKIDDVRLYDRVLTSQEINDIYSLGATSKINTTIKTQSNLLDSLYGHWTMDGRDVASTTATVTSELRDSSGNNNHMDWRQHGSTTMPGKIGQAIWLDGVDDFATSTASAVGGVIGSTDWSVSLWARPEDFSTSGGQTRTVLSAATGNSGAARQWIMFSTAGVVQTQHGGSINSMGVTAKLNEWIHVGLVYDDTNNLLHFYVNGVNTGVKNPASLDGGDGPLQIGKFPTSDSGYFKGGVDDVRVYTRMLTDEEMLQLYQLGS